MNYIKHLTGFYQKFMTDARFNPTHVSLYHALFQLWNLNRFENPVSINRSQILHFSKIGSFSTFYKCMYDLHKWGYIEYLPSHNPFKGSLVNMYNFETRPLKNEGSTGTDSKQAPDQYQSKTDTSTEQAMYPSLNSLNVSNQIGEGENSHNQNIRGVKKRNLGQETKRKKVAQKKEKAFERPGLDQVIEFFLGENFPEKEARKFFYHFESNGWKVSGKSPMISWTAAAYNWMLNAERFNPELNASKSIIKKDKNYDEPL